MTLGRDWIEAHVPQKNGMCLLDEVLSWDSEQVWCRSATHHRADHPLRAHAQLGSASAIEYAAQAVAVHGALCESGSHGNTRIGLLASVRDVELAVVRLDTVAGDLLVHVRRIQSDARGALYAFDVSEQRTTQPSVPLAQGRLSLWLDGALDAGSA
jgi:predicted hotdog family 3-hydroxylacyl-ACP dehydratase